MRRSRRAPPPTRRRRRAADRARPWGRAARGPTGRALPRRRIRSTLRAGGADGHGHLVARPPRVGVSVGVAQALLPQGVEGALAPGLADAGTRHRLRTVLETA